MAEVMGNSENLMESMDLQSDRMQGGLIPTLLMENSRTQLLHLAQLSALDKAGQVSCGQERGSHPPVLAAWSMQVSPVTLVPVCAGNRQGGSLKSSLMPAGSVLRHWGTDAWP